MRALTRIHLLLPATALLLGASAGALAGEPAVPTDEEKKACGQKGYGVTVEMDDDQLTFICRSDGRDEMTVIDLGDLDAVIEEAVVGVGEALAELDDLQLDMHFGKDNMVRLATPDQEFEVNLDLLAAEVGRAVEMALAGLERRDWSHVGDRHRTHIEMEEIENIEDMDELQAELDTLRKEMADLKRELKRLHEGR